MVVYDRECSYCLPQFALLRNTTRWGKIEGTRSLGLCLFSYSKHANERLFFQVLLTFSPINGELPVFTLSKEVLDSQLEQADKLDGKADSTQISATALVSAALVLEAVLITLNGSLLIRIIQIALLLALLVIHVVVVINASNAYRIADYQGLANPETLRTRYLDMPDKVTKKALLKAMTYAYQENEKINDKKVKLIDRAINWRTAEAAILVVVLLTQIISVLFTHSTK